MRCAKKDGKNKIKDFIDQLKKVNDHQKKLYLEKIGSKGEDAQTKLDHMENEKIAEKNIKQSIKNLEFKCSQDDELLREFNGIYAEIESIINYGDTKYMIQKVNYICDNINKYTDDEKLINLKPEFDKFITGLKNVYAKGFSKTDYNKIVDGAKDYYRDMIKETYQRVMIVVKQNSKELKELQELTKDIKGRNKKFWENKIKSQFMVTIWSHNGGRYDHFILLKELFDIQNIIIKNGILMLQAFEFIKFVDFYRHCSESLASLCKSFKIDKKYSKTEFPHDFVNETKNINYIGDVPEGKYWPNGEVPEEHLNKPFDLKKVSISYQKLDVLALQQTFKKYCELIHKTTNLSADKYLTGPSVAYKYVLNHITTNYNIYTIKNMDIHNFVRASVRGGRSFVQKSYYVIKNYDEYKLFDNLSEQDKKLMYDKVGEYLVDFDATSMYPAAMCLFKFPIGLAEVLHHGEFQRVMDEINGLEYNYHCVLECDIVYTNREEIVCPLISMKDDKGKTKYDMKDKTNLIITNVDVEEAIKNNNAKITKIHNVVEWKESAFIFKKCIGKLFNERLKAKAEKNDALSAVLKLLMNSSYGKLIMKLIDCETKIINDCPTFDKHLLENIKLTGWTPINEEQIIMEFKKDLSDNDIRTPVHLGAFILAYSKRIMNDCIAKFNGFKSWENTFYYTDTDYFKQDFRSIEN